MYNSNDKDTSTSIPRVFLLKLPSFRSRPESLVIEVNPIDTFGSPTKKRGILIRSSSVLDQIRKILTNSKIEHPAKSIDEVIPEVRSQ